MDSKLLWTGKEASFLNDLQTLDHCQSQGLFRGRVWRGHYGGHEAKCQKEAADNPDRVFTSVPVPAFWVFHFWPTIYPVLTSPLPTKPLPSYLPHSPEHISCQWHWSTESFPTGALGCLLWVQAAVPPPAVGSKPHPWVWVTNSQGLSGTFPALAQKPVVVQSLSWVWLCATPHALGPKSQNIKQKEYCNKFNKDFRSGPHQK